MNKCTGPLQIYPLVIKDESLNSNINGQKMIRMECKSCKDPLLQCELCQDVIHFSIFKTTLDCEEHNLKIDHHPDPSYQDHDSQISLKPQNIVDKIQSDINEFSRKGYVVICSTCSYPNVLESESRKKCGLHLKNVHHPGLNISLEKFIMLCVLNRQSLDFKAESLEILDNCNLLDSQSRIRKKFRRRNKTIDSRVTFLNAESKRYYFLMLELEKIVLKGSYIPEIGLREFKILSMNESFTKYDNRLLKQFYGNNPLNHEMEILLIADKVVEGNSTQKLRLLSLYEIFQQSQNSALFSNFAAMRNINFEMQKIGRHRLFTLNEMRNGISVVGQALTSLIYELINNRKADTFSGSFNRSSNSIIQDECARSLHGIELLNKLFSTIIFN